MWPNTFSPIIIYSIRLKKRGLGSYSGHILVWIVGFFAVRL